PASSSCSLANANATPPSPAAPFSPPVAALALVTPAPAGVFSICRERSPPIALMYGRSTLRIMFLTISASCALPYLRLSSHHTSPATLLPQRLIPKNAIRNPPHPLLPPHPSPRLLLSRRRSPQIPRLSRLRLEALDG